MLAPTKELELRPHQVDGKNWLRQGFVDGKKWQLLVMPTGAGKTVSAADLMRNASMKGTRCAFIVDRLALVDQTSAVLDDYGLDHGIIQQRHPRFRPDKLIQVCSAQTLEKRDHWTDGLGLAIIDEGHTVRRGVIEQLKAMPELPVIGLTATPFTGGLSTLYENIVCPVTHNELVAQGFLVPARYFVAQPIDMAGAATTAGEWTAKEVEQRGMTILGDIAAEWVKRTKEFFGGPAKTIVFTATVEQGAHICSEFARHGFNFQQISYLDGNGDERRSKIEEFRKPDSLIDGLVSCEVLAKGFDVPDVLVGIDARPFRASFSAHIQQLGRVLRSSPGKEFALWLDHSGNLHRFWLDQCDLFANGVHSLEDTKLADRPREEPPERVIEQIMCQKCKHMMPPKVSICPSCGHERPRRQTVEMGAGEMAELEYDESGKKLPKYLLRRNDVWSQLKWLSMEMRSLTNDDHRRRWCQAKYKDFYGRFAKRDWGATEPMIADLSLQRRIRMDAKKYRQQRAAERREHETEG